MNSEIDTSAAIVEVESQMSALAGIIRQSQRDAALSIDPELQAFGLKVLRLLDRHGPMPAGAVAAALFVDKSVISRYAKRISALGLLETQPDPRDGRGRILTVTPLAHQKILDLRAGNTAVVHQRLGRMTAADLEELARLLEQLNTP
jgi:DNA-binding MarR family transcriptional regulator